VFVLDGLGPVAAGQQMVDPAGDVLGPQIRHGQLGEVRGDVQPDITPVIVDGFLADAGQLVDVRGAPVGDGRPGRPGGRLGRVRYPPGIHGALGADGVDEQLELGRISLGVEGNRGLATVDDV